MKIKEIYYWFYRTWKYKIKYFPSEVKWFIQRGRRGYADCDTWSFDHYLSKVIASGLRDLGTRCYGCPDKYFDSEKKDDECWKWREKLHSIASVFEKYPVEIDVPGYENRKYEFVDSGNGYSTMKATPEVTEEEMEQYRKMCDEKHQEFLKAFDELRDHWGNLWD